MKHFRYYFGIVVWCAALVGSAVIPVALSDNNWVLSLGRVWSYLQNERQVVVVNFDQSIFVKEGDPVYLKTEFGWKRIGQVTSEQYTEDGFLQPVRSVTIAFFGDAPPLQSGDGCFVTLHETPGSFEWALKRLFPKSKRDRMLADLKLTFEQHQQEIIGGFTPIVMDLVREIGLVLQEDLRNALTSQRDKIVKIAARYQEGFVEKRLVPLLKEEIWPIVERRSQPILNQVGSEIWQRASIWRFGWRLAYDKFPLTSSNLVQQEWTRFVKTEAMPVVENHADDFFQLARNVMREIAANEEVKRAGKDGVDQLLKDQEIKSLISETLWEVLFENERLTKLIKENLESERTIDIVRSTSQKFEDEIRKIGDRIFGTFEGGITKEFAGVLRKEILRRDQRWLVLHFQKPTNPKGTEFTREIHGYFSPDTSDRPEFVRYRNDK
jgi:hypothetical protein